MQFVDFSPPIVPSSDQQRDAMQKGLGRALQWAAAGRLDTEPLLDACLHDQRFDIQCEANRGEWLWKIIGASGRVQQLRESILDSWRVVDCDRDAYQLCELALHYARAGDDGFRRQLYEFVGRRQIPDAANIGEAQLLRLDGEDAFRFLARLRGQNLVTSDWEWDDLALIEQAIEDFGTPRVRELLTGDPDISRFAAGWRENLTSPIDPESQQQAFTQKMKALKVDEVIRSVRGEQRPNWLTGWGTIADESDLKIVLEEIWTEQNSAAIAKLLRIFWNRPLPIFDSRLIDLCTQRDDDVSRAAFRSLEQNTHPLIREFAFQEVRQPTLDRPIVGLLIKNFEQGDEQRLLELIELPGDLSQRHWMLMDVIHLLEQNEEADSLTLGQISYFHTPCQECRFYAARLLFDRDNAPAWLADECRFDANEDMHTLGEPKSGLGHVNDES